MSGTILTVAGSILLLVIVVKAFVSLKRGRSSGPNDDWKNEAYMAREQSGTWAESELAPGNSTHSAPPSVLTGLGTS